MSGRQLSVGQLSGSIVGGQLSGGQSSGGQLSGGQLSGGQLSGVNCRPPGTAWLKFLTREVFSLFGDLNNCRGSYSWIQAFP